MRIIYYIVGVILIISGFLSFSLIGVFNDYIWMNFTYHIILTIVGFILILLGIFSMIIFLKQKDTKENSNKEENVIIDNKDSSKSNLKKKKNTKEK
jgi:uncharacterized membrane protein